MSERGPGPEVDSLTASADPNPETTKLRTGDENWTFGGSTHPPEAIGDRFAVINNQTGTTETKTTAIDQSQVDKAEQDKADRDREPKTFIQDIDQAHLVANRSAGILGRQEARIDNQYTPTIDLARATGDTERVTSLENARDTARTKLYSQDNLDSVYRTQNHSTAELLGIVRDESMMSKGPGYNYDAGRRIPEADFALLASKLGPRAQESVSTDANGNEYQIVDYTRPDGYIVRFFQQQDGESHLGITIVAPENT